MLYNDNKLKALFDRVYTGKMEQNDQEDIKQYIKKVFGDGSLNPNPSLLHQFNNLVVQLADEIAKPMVSDMLGVFATFRPANRGDLIKIDIPKKHRAKFIWSANGSGVDLVRVAGQKSIVAVPATFTAGFYYEPMDMANGNVEKFRELINDAADAKARLYLDEIYKLVATAVSSGKIPAANVLSGDNLTLQEYNKLASTLSRYGGRPIFVADTLLIDYFAMQQATDTTYKELLTENVKAELLNALNITRIARTDAVNLVNPFTDETNSKVELPVNKGYMFAGSISQKPFTVVEYGGLRQMTDQDIEDERIKVKLSQEASINLLYGEAVGVVEENTAVTL